MTLQEGLQNGASDEENPLIEFYLLKVLHNGIRGRNKLFLDVDFHTSRYVTFEFLLQFGRGPSCIVAEEENVLFRSGQGLNCSVRSGHRLRDEAP